MERVHIVLISAGVALYLLFFLDFRNLIVTPTYYAMSVGADQLYVFPVSSATIAESMYVLKTFGALTQQRAVVVCFKRDLLHPTEMSKQVYRNRGSY